MPYNKPTNFSLILLLVLPLLSHLLNDIPLILGSTPECPQIHHLSKPPRNWKPRLEYIMSII